MHTFEHKGGRIHHDNFDLGGDVIIVNDKGEEIQIPGALLLAFMSEYIRDKLIAEIEQMSVAALIKAVASLGLTTPAGGGSS